MWIKTCPEYLSCSDDFLGIFFYLFTVSLRYVTTNEYTCARVLEPDI